MFGSRIVDVGIAGVSRKRFFKRSNEVSFGGRQVSNRIMGDFGTEGAEMTETT